MYPNRDPAGQIRFGASRSGAAPASRRAARAVLLAILLVPPLMLATAAEAATFHVATGGSDGSGNGSIGNPWATISHAVDSVPDDSLVLVAPGTYNGQVALDSRFDLGVTVRSEVPYQARLRHNATVVRCFYGKGITLEGFDIAHSGPGAGALVMQISDVLDDPAGIEKITDITLRDNIFHDSYNNDLLKINDNAQSVRVLGNMFYNQAGSDEHIDINSVHDVLVEGNVFFNDFAGSGRSDTGTSSYVVIKDSNAGSDGRLGSEDITVRRNVFLHWEGSSGQGFVRVGEDGTSNFEAIGVLIENNLMLGNGTATIRSPLQFQGVQDVTARANTIVGNMPALEYGLRIVTVGASPATDGLFVHNNIWSDPTGTMGATFNRGGATVNLAFDNNLYWNDGNPFPTSSESILEVADDASGVIADPLLPDPSTAPLPRWNPGSGTFADGSTTIAAVFENLARSYAEPAAASPALDAADAANMPADDILGQPRSAGGAPDIGAWERLSCDGMPDPSPCDDGNPCTVDDECSGGVCAGDAMAADGNPCDDGDACTAADVCAAGSCVGDTGAANGQACDDGQPCTHGDVCTAGACGGSAEPVAGCIEAGRGALDLRGRLKWNWKGTGVAFADFGDPAATTDYRLCVYDRGAGIASAVATTSSPAGGNCATRACWKMKAGKGFTYKDRDGTPEGITRLKVSVAASGAASLKVAAAGPALVLPSLPLDQDPDVVVQLLASGAGCWQTTLPAPARDNTASRFRDSR
ncbi:MAG: choice-of-anchor Q domain-containing protein [Candidatus Binatia bacterium]